MNYRKAMMEKVIWIKTTSGETNKPVQRIIQPCASSQSQGPDKIIFSMSLLRILWPQKAREIIRLKFQEIVQMSIEKQAQKLKGKKKKLPRPCVDAAQ